MTTLSPVPLPLKVHPLTKCCFSDFAWFQLVISQDLFDVRFTFVFWFDLSLNFAKGTLLVIPFITAVCDAYSVAIHVHSTVIHRPVTASFSPSSSYGLMLILTFCPNYQMPNGYISHKIRTKEKGVLIQNLSSYSIRKPVRWMKYVISVQKDHFLQSASLISKIGFVNPLITLEWIKFRAVWRNWLFIKNGKER